MRVLIWAQKRENKSVLQSRSLVSGHKTKRRVQVSFFVFGYKNEKTEVMVVFSLHATLWRAEERNHGFVFGYFVLTTGEKTDGRKVHGPF